MTFIRHRSSEIMPLINTNLSAQKNLSLLFNSFYLTLIQLIVQLSIFFFQLLVEFSNYSSIIDWAINLVRNWRLH